MIDKETDWKDISKEFPKVKSGFTQILIKVITTNGEYYTVAEADYDDNNKVVITNGDRIMAWDKDEFAEQIDTFYWDYIK